MAVNLRIHNNPLSQQDNAAVDTNIDAATIQNITALVSELMCLMNQLAMELGKNDRQAIEQLKGKFEKLTADTFSKQSWQAVAVLCTGLACTAFGVATALAPAARQGLYRILAEQTAPGVGRAIETKFSALAQLSSSKAGLCQSEISNKQSSLSESIQALSRAALELLQLALASMRTQQ